MAAKKSPLRYPGGKTRACKVLETIVVKEFGIPKVIYSPFFGGGSFEFHMNGKHGCIIHGADGFAPLANFWQRVKNGQKELVEAVKSLKPLTKEKFTELRSNIMAESNKTTKAAYYFALNRCSFSGATLSGGFSKESENTRFNAAAIERLNGMNMDGVDVVCEDFREFLNNVEPSSSSIIYLDPPYYVDSKLYGTHGDMHDGFDHAALANILKTKKNWILCYNDCEYIRKLYEGYEIQSVSWSYGMNKSKQSSEIIILSKA